VENAQLVKWGLCDPVSLRRERTMPIFRISFAAVLAALMMIPPCLSQSALPSEGAKLLQAGKLSEARDAFEAVLSADGPNPEALAGEVQSSERLALEARAAGRMGDALQTLVQQYAPQNARLLYDLGILEDQMGLFYDADKALATAMVLTPDEPDVLYAVARVKMDLGQLTAAEEKMKAYLKLRPMDASAQFGLGRIYQIGLEFGKARAAFLRSIELQPVQTESYFELGDLALKQGDYEEAAAQFKKTLDRDAKHGGALEGSGEISFKQKQYEQARAFLERAIAASPEYAPSHYYMGLTLARLGRKEESARELELATKLTEAEKKQAGSRIQQAPETKPE
jgi:tetratricopeptide (TPR) repeat protein